MDTTITDLEGEENTTQDSLPTAEGGAISKQTTQPIQAETDTTEDNEQTHSSDTCIIL